MSKPASGSMRDSLPEVAAWIDDLRVAFGRDAIDGQMRRAKAGAPVFCVEVDGVVVAGTKRPAERTMSLAKFRRLVASDQPISEDEDAI